MMENYLTFAAIITVFLVQIITFTYLLKSKGVKKTLDDVQAPVFPVAEEIFVSFPCTNCQASLVLNQKIYPGEVALLECENCHTNWTIYNPQLIIKPTKDLPESIKVRVAENSPMNARS